LNSNIEILIEKLEEEQVSLHQLISDAVKSGDYLTAHAHNTALGHISKQLRTIRNFKDKQYDKKEELKQRIVRLEDYVHTLDNERFREYTRKMISENKIELEALINSSDEMSPQESTILHQQLELLSNKKIKRLAIVLMQTFDLRMDIRSGKSGIQISIPHLKKIRKEGIIDERKFGELIGLGFKITSNENRLTLTLTGQKTELFDRLKVIILIVVFEIFYFREFGGDSFIEVIH